MKTFELQPQYINQKSYYGKARVVYDRSSSTYELISYATKVATYNTFTGELILKGLYSQTTKKHIVDFINQFTGYMVPNSQKELQKFIK